MKLVNKNDRNGEINQLKTLNKKLNILLVKMLKEEEKEKKLNYINKNT